MLFIHQNSISGHRSFLFLHSLSVVPECVMWLSIACFQVDAWGGHRLIFAFRLAVDVRTVGKVVRTLVIHGTLRVATY